MSTIRKPLTMSEEQERADRALMDDDHPEALARALARSDDEVDALRAALAACEKERDEARAGNSGWAKPYRNVSLARDEARADVRALAEALDEIRPAVNGWHFASGGDQQRFDGFAATVDAALARPGVVALMKEGS